MEEILALGALSPGPARSAPLLLIQADSGDNGPPAPVPADQLVVLWWVTDHTVFTRK